MIRNLHDHQKIFWWENLKTDELLKVKLSELDLVISGTGIERLIQKLYRELEKKDLKIKPKIWISTEWFCPDGHLGFAVPYYLFHPRLNRLHRKYLGFLEGNTPLSCMKILRHETGHVVDNAYGLRRNKTRRESFGLSSTPYPTDYEAKPYSKNYVRHLEAYYAQSHPDEDFAETFAVWLDPKSQWRARYDGWPALKKLKNLHEILKEHRGRQPLDLSKASVSELKNLNMTLGGFFRHQQREFGIGTPGYFERDLRKIFKLAKPESNEPSAYSFLKSERSLLTRRVSEETGFYRYKVERAMDNILETCKTKRLVLRHSKRWTRSSLIMLMETRIPLFVRKGFHRLTM